MSYFFFLIFIIYLLIFGWVGSSLLRTGFSLVAASGGYSSLRCACFSLRWLLLLGSTGSRCVGFSSCGSWALGVWASVAVAHGLTCSAACGIFPNQGSNPCPLHWQVILNYCAAREALKSYFLACYSRFSTN